MSTHKALVNVVKAWDSLESGHHPQYVVEEWLVRKMAPAMERARKTLKLLEAEESEIKRLESQVASLKEWVEAVVKEVIYPLAHEDSDRGKIAEGFGQLSVGLGQPKLGGGPGSGTDSPRGPKKLQKTPKK